MTDTGKNLQLTQVGGGRGVVWGLEILRSEATEVEIFPIRVEQGAVRKLWEWAGRDPELPPVFN